MRAFVTTVAGQATRFCRDLPKQMLKCIYYEKNPRHTLLSCLLDRVQDYDEIVIVGGWQFVALQDYIEKVLPSELRAKIMLVCNEEYALYGTGWSLYKGLQALEGKQPDSILFAEGDLYVDRDSLRHIEVCDSDVITVSQMPIEADKSVAVYFSEAGCPHYIYDTSHGLLSVPEPFRSIHNSAQIWKFADPIRLFRLLHEMPEEAHQKTNLVLINRYFSETKPEALRVIPITAWINCNTLQDFQRIPF